MSVVPGKWAIGYYRGCVVQVVSGVQYGVMYSAVAPEPERVLGPRPELVNGEWVHVVGVNAGARRLLFDLTLWDNSGPKRVPVDDLAANFRPFHMGPPEGYTPPAGWENEE